MFKHYIHTLVILTIVTGSTLSVCDQSIPEENINQKIERLEKIFSKISSDKILERLMLEEKRKLIQELLDASPQNSSTKNDSDAHFFEPKEPKPICQEDKNVAIQERIGKKYIGNVPQQVENVVLYFSNHEQCIQDNIGIYNRVLLHGHPGTGKSHLFKVITQELGIHSLSFSASFFADKYIGESSRRIRKAFEAAKKLNKPILIFIDEIDALATKRNNSTHDEQRGTLITLLTELQELQDNKNIFVFAATNDLNALDPAIKDRFAGSIAEIKELNLDEKAKLFQTVFANKGEIIKKEFAARLAKVTNTKTKDKETNISRPAFSNRDVEYIVTTALLLRYFDCKKNPEICKEQQLKNKEKHLARFVRKAIDSTGKNAAYATNMHAYDNEVYSDGI